MRILAVCLVVLPSLALAEADGPDFYRVDVREGSALMLRAGPGVTHPVLARIPSGTGRLPNLGCEGGLSLAEWTDASEAEREAGRKTRWCRTRFAGQEGWAAGWFLRED